jgi:hypothetical protein
MSNEIHIAMDKRMNGIRKAFTGNEEFLHFPGLSFAHSQSSTEVIHQVAEKMGVERVNDVNAGNVAILVLDVLADSGEFEELAAR